MAKTNTATANTASKASKPVSDVIHGMQLRSSGLAKMSQLIIGARRTNNEHAISKDEFLAAGLTEQAFNQWVEYVSALHTRVKKYSETLNDREIPVATQQKLERDAFGTWRDVLKNATTTDFCEKWFVRKSDISLLVRCDYKKVKTAIGSQEGHYSPTDFRRQLEWIIGARISSGTMLSDKDVEIIEGYEAALKSIESGNKRLNGYTKGDKTEIGLLKTLEAVKGKLQTARKCFAEAGIKNEPLNTAIRPYEKAVSDVETEISGVRKSIKTAEEKRDKLKGAYDNLIAERKKIEGIMG